jgi:tripartite-type tricarboxylate transporter receptor subunit TctC
MTIQRRTVLSALPFGLGLGCLWPASAQTVQLRELNLLVPTPPASQPDQIARWLAEPLSRRAGMRTTVLNRPGAAGAIAADAVLAAPPESGTLLLGGLDHVAYSHLNSARRALDPFKDFVPVAAVNRDTWLVVGSLEHPARDIASLVQLAKAKGSLNYGSSGEGTTAHLLGARLCKALGIEAQHIPYKETYVPDLISGRLHFVVAATPAVIGPVRDRRLAPLAALTNERLPQLSETASIKELGWPDQVFYGGLFLFAPAALSSYAHQLNSWVVEALRGPEIVARFAQVGIEPTPLDLDDARRAVTERLRIVDAMRLTVFGRSR